MMTAAVGSLTELFPAMAKEITAFGAASNLLSGLDGIYMSIFIALPLSEYLYKIFYRMKYKKLPDPPVTLDPRLKNEVNERVRKEKGVTEDEI